MGSAGSRGSPGRASSGPAAASCGPARRSVPWGSLPGARPADGRPPLTLGMNAPCPRRAAEGTHEFTLAATRSPPSSPAPARRAGLPGWRGASPAPEPIPGSGGRPMGALIPLPRAPAPHAASTARRRAAALQRRRSPAALRAPSLQGTVQRTKGGSALFSSLTPKSPLPRRERRTGRAGTKGEDGERPSARGAGRFPAYPACHPFPKVAFLPCLPPKPACHNPSFPPRTVMGLSHVTSPKNPTEDAKEPLPTSQPPQGILVELLHGITRFTHPQGRKKKLSCTKARYYLKILPSISQKRPSF